MRTPTTPMTNEIAEAEDLRNEKWAWLTKLFLISTALFFANAIGYCSGIDHQRRKQDKAVMMQKAQLDHCATSHSWETTVRRQCEEELDRCNEGLVSASSFIRSECW